MLEYSKKSYSGRLLNHAWEETREHLNLELALSTIGGCVAGLVPYGLSWVSALRGIGYGALAFVAIIGAAFLIHLILSPRSLDIEGQQEIAKHKDDLLATLGELEDKRSKPELRGAISQVFFKPRYGIFVLQLSLWNTSKTPTSILKFELEVFTDRGEYTGSRISAESYAYVPLGQREDDKQSLGPLDAYDHPPADGYIQGRVEKGRWLCFILTQPFEREFEIRKIVMTALDIFDITHKIVSEPPLMGRGSIIGRYGLGREDED